jgi:hypothetical protein
MPLPYTEISTKTISRGTNANASVTLPAYRVVGYGTVSATNGDPIDRLSVTGLSKIKGVTAKAIAPGETGDVHTEGVVPVESTGAGVIAAGQYLTASATADATEGRVAVAAPAAGANAFIVGKATTDAPATAGAIVMMQILPSVMQGA